jgi:hypothetical protein
MTERNETAVQGAADGLRAALREALSVRDATVDAPSFEALAARDSSPSRPFDWRPAVAMTASTLIVVAGVLLWTNEKAKIPMLDAHLVEKLSPASYWRVPSDELLAYAPAPVSLDIAIDSGLPVSLEESLL